MSLFFVIPNIIMNGKFHFHFFAVGFKFIINKGG